MSVDLDNFESVDVVELVMALEEAFPDLEFPNDASREEIIRIVQDQLGDDPDGAVAAFVRRRGPSGHGGATAAPGE